MIDPANVPGIELEEWLARYVLYSKHVRTPGRTVKPDPFIPHPYQDLSVTRHLMATEEEIWNLGEQVAQQQSLNFYGRFDVLAKSCSEQKLTVVPDPIPANPNHANIRGWPQEKPQQKIIALLVAAQAVYRARP